MILVSHKKHKIPDGVRLAPVAALERSESVAASGATTLSLRSNAATRSEFSVP
jgi:hypothetical protein